MNKTIRGQMVLGGTALVVCIHLVIGCVVYFVLNDHLLANQLANQTQTATALCKAISQWRNTYERQALDIASNLRVQQYLRAGIDNAQGDLRRILGEYTGDAQMPAVVVLADDKGNLVETQSADISAYIDDRMATADRLDGAAVWDSGYEPNYVVLYRRVNDQTYEVGQRLGYLFLLVDSAELLDLFEDYRLHPSQRFSLNGITNGFEASERGFFYEYNENYAELLHSEVTFDGWKLRTWTSKTVALAPTQNLFQLLFVVLGATLLAAVTLFCLFAARMTKQLSIMSDTIHKYSRGDFEARAPVVQNNEIGRLAHTLNEMAQHIQTLIQQLRQKERQKRKLQLQTLEYQINPHFLYNTLDSINLLARKNNDPVVGDMVISLSRLFRLGLHNGQEMVPVEDEAAHVYYYLRIQSVRFEGQLNWKMDIDTDIKQVQIIKFILQPLVENAINHGIRKKEGAGLLTLKGWREEGYILFEVQDDGVGIAPDRLAQIQQVLENGELAGGTAGCFGLNNVNQRIRLHYGAKYALLLSSRPGRGTTVTVKLPIQAPPNTPAGER